MVAKASPTRLLIPAHRRPSRERLLATEPFFLRDLAQVPVEASPRILAFETDAFIADFLAAAGQTAPLPALRPWRDWSEPPDGRVDAAGQPRYPATIARREAQPTELEPASGPVMDDDGIPHGDSASTPAWLRKLYLPLHERFNLIAFDLVCGAAGWPRVARSRIKGAGAVIRRLVARPDGEHWEDWIAVDEKHGAWVEVLDADLRPAPGAAPADPTALTGLSTAASVKLHALFGLAADAPLPAIALASQPLNLVPPNAGKAADHCTLFGYLPVFSGAREVSAERLAAGTIADIASRMAERTRSRLDGVFASAAGLRSAAQPQLLTLLADTLLPARPGNAEITTSDTLVAGLLAAPPFGLAHPADALAQGIDLALLKALACLWTQATSAGTAGADCDGSVLTAAQLWDQSAADTAASASAVFDTLPDPSGLPGNQTALWLAASVAASPAGWDVLVRRRLFQLVDAWLAGSALPPPPQGASSLVTENHLALLAVIALLRLRGGRLAIMASINRTLFGDDKRSELLAIGPGGKLEFGLAALGEQIDAVLAQESARGDPQATPPWPALAFAELGADLPRVKRIHQTGQALAQVYAGFDAALAAAGTAAVAQRDARAASVEAAIAGAVSGSPSLAAQGLDWLEQPACGLLVLPAFRFAQTPFGTLRDAAAAAYTGQPEALALPEARATDAQPRLRFDAEHLYAAWGWARVAGRTPCEPDRVVWTLRSEPFSIADPTDLLGARPASIQMPDIPRLLRDIPRIARARARPFAGIAAPPGSGVKVGDAMTDTRRDFGLGMICNFGIPILTICALILFNIIFSILIKLPAFSWMLFLKFCLPFPKRGP